jgi:hypothetical protein
MGENDGKKTGARQLELPKGYREGDAVIIRLPQSLLRKPELEPAVGTGAKEDAPRKPGELSPGQKARVWDSYRRHAPASHLATDGVVKLFLASRGVLPEEAGNAGGGGGPKQDTAYAKYLRDRALIDAVERNDMAGAVAALDNGADMEARNKFGQTAWMIADEKGHADIADMLKKRGADVLATSAGAMVPEFDSLIVRLPKSLCAPEEQTPVAHAGEMIGESEDGEPEACGPGALRRAMGRVKDGLRALASGRTTVFYAGLIAGMFVLAATGGISNRVEEYRAGKAAIASQKAQEPQATPQGGGRWKNWTPAQEKQRQANDGQLIGAARKSDYKSAKAAIDNGVTWEALGEARRIAALNKDWRIVHLTSWVTSSVLSPSNMGPRTETKKPGQPQGREQEDAVRRFVSATGPDMSCETHWEMGSVKLALKKPASQDALSRALWNVGDNRMNADEKQSTEVAYLIAQRMKPMAEPEELSKAGPKKPEATAHKAQQAPAPKAPGASLTPREKARLLRELNRAVERGDEKAVERIMEKAGMDAKPGHGGPSS